MVPLSVTLIVLKVVTRVCQQQLRLLLTVIIYATQLILMTSDDVIAWFSVIYGGTWYIFA